MIAYLCVGASRYHDLEAYRQAIAIADDMHAAVREWNALDAWSTGIQLVRAADSIGANIAEAYGRYGHRDQRRFLYVARGSAYETEHWIARALARGLLPDAELQHQIEELIKTLSGLIRAHQRTP